MSKSDCKNSALFLRREFLAGLGAVGAAALIPEAISFAQGMAAFTSRLYRIDTHHHISSPGFIAAITARKTGQRPLMEWTPEKSLAEMDKAGVQTAVMSTSEPGVWFGDNEAARSLARECNEYGAKLISDHPGRFGMFTTVPLPDIDGCLREIEYGMDTLKLDGIGMMTSYIGKYLGDPMFTPVMEELNRRKAIVYFHPFRAECCKDLQPELGTAVIELGTDTTRNIASLLFSGTASKYPEIRFIFSHGGGTAPYLMNRFVTVMQRPDIAARLPKGLLYEVQKFYYDTAMFFNPNSWPTFKKVVPVSQMLYGTDYPFVTPYDVAKGLDDCGLSRAERRAIDRENALRLFPRLNKV